MTETLHRPTETEGYRSSAEMLARLNDLETETPDTAEQTEALDSRSLSPTADRIRNASERIAQFLEKRSIARAHDEALEEYRERDHSGYVDHVANLASAVDEAGNPLESQDFNKNLLRTEEARADREALVEAGKQRLHAIGEVALSTAKNAGLITLGLGVMGYAAAEKRARVAHFKAESKYQERRLRKSHVKETAAFDKAAKKQAKQLDKQAAKDSRRGAKEDRRFERDMNRKVRKEKFEAKKEAVATKLESGARKVGNTYRHSLETYEKLKASTTEKKRKLGAFAIKARTAGSAAWAAGREELKK